MLFARVQQHDVVCAGALPGAAVRDKSAQVQDLSLGAVGSDAVPGIPRPQTVPPYRLAALAAALPAELAGPDAEVTGITHASGDVRPGALDRPAHTTSHRSSRGAEGTAR